MGRNIPHHSVKTGLHWVYYDYDHVDWLVHKTFISHDMKFEEQKQDEQRLLLHMQLQLLKTSMEKEHPNEIDKDHTCHGSIQILGKDNEIVRIARSSTF